MIWRLFGGRWDSADWREKSWNLTLIHVPAKAGIQSAVVTMEQKLDLGLRGEDGELLEGVSPVFGRILCQLHPIGIRQSAPQVKSISGSDQVPRAIN